MQNFTKEFNTLNYVIKKSDSILLFAHTHPDGDATGSTLAFKYYIESLGKKVDVACFDPFPAFLENLFSDRFEFPSHLDIQSYDLIIACDAVERGFHKILPEIKDKKIVALLDHHPSVTIKGDINIVDTKFSSVCEILYQFFTINKIEITKKIATPLLLGILYDTGSFQHSNTTSDVMQIASNLVKKGAPLTKLTEVIFSNKNITTLKLWGRAFEKAKLNPQNGMIVSVLTQEDIAELEATTDDIAQIAQILNTVPGTKMAMILSERSDGTVKGSLRSEEYKNVDVSKIAAQFGGGGHKLASGFEVKGKIVETEEGWKIV
jgi:bifunctional oligoribonuclease and PAP phosphatase NrnA